MRTPYLTIEALLLDLFPDVDQAYLTIGRHTDTHYLLTALQQLAQLPAYRDIHSAALLQLFFQHAQPVVLAKCAELLANACLLSRDTLQRLAHHQDLELLHHHLRQLKHYSYPLFKRFAWHLLQAPVLLNYVPQLNLLLRSRYPDLLRWQAVFGDDTSWQLPLAQEKLSRLAERSPGLLTRISHSPKPLECADLLLTLARLDSLSDIFISHALHYENPQFYDEVLRRWESHTKPPQNVVSALLGCRLNKSLKSACIKLLSLNLLSVSSWQQLLIHPDYRLVIPLIQQLSELGYFEEDQLTLLLNHPELESLNTLVTFCIEKQLDFDLRCLLTQTYLSFLLQCTQVCHSRYLLQQVLYRATDFLFAARYLVNKRIPIDDSLVYVLCSSQHPKRVATELALMASKYHILLENISAFAQLLNGPGRQDFLALLDRLVARSPLSVTDQQLLFRHDSRHFAEALVCLDFLESHPGYVPLWNTLLLRVKHKPTLLLTLQRLASQPLQADIDSATLYRKLLKHRSPADLLTLLQKLDQREWG